jgi:DNA-binding response OmpR family regulator
MPKANLILLAMEQSPTLELLDKALRAGGYDVAVAKNPEALDKTLQETTPTLLLITEKLGNKSGLKSSKINSGTLSHAANHFICHQS